VVKKSEKIIGKGKNFQVKIEKLKTNISTYKTLSFTIHHQGKLVYLNTDIKKIYD